MGIGFRKRVKIAPGVNLNFSRKGVSTTIGGKGASVNIGSKGVYANASIPGTGIYARNKIVGTTGADTNSSADKKTARKSSLQIPLPIAIVLWIIIITAFLITFICSD